MVDSIFTNGVIAVREQRLLGEKILRYTELSADEALRALKESGFGGAESTDGEQLCRAESEALDAFVREYAPTNAELTYLLAPRDFHNAKAICKAEKLKSDAENLLAPEGLRTVSSITAAIQSGDYLSLGAELGEAVKKVIESEEITGAEIGAIFDNAMYAHLIKNCGKSRVLKKLTVRKIDCTNILTAMRSKSAEHAEKLYIEGGTLKISDLARVHGADANAFENSPYREFYKLCLDAKEKGKPFTEAEKALDASEAEYFYEKRFELQGKQPFLYYVFRRRAEISNVRIVLVCLNAGLPAQDIKNRLRAIN